MFTLKEINIRYKIFQPQGKSSAVTARYFSIKEIPTSSPVFLSVAVPPAP